ncbi:CocE/NonD family hydrolase [Dictyobacter aurantiacus]|uniref:X-Pro dipeptidyl-peptidase n=1 Tax=Dictyobacter aurantiacus TaxID=1936993 RepID=A0A401ZME4_9CHLR|nr:CocE/NonD family hydrolase [Dictyobacter aurantiacus]GCE08035.1 X-Pro dipeptidyl-peptidase [Dictyobacter aurantiacus]
MIIEQNLMIPMRDGVKLATDVYRPEGEGRWPVLVVRHPYNKDFRMPLPGWEDRPIAININLFAERVVAAGYVIVLQDVRGRYASEGEFQPFLFESSDGVDTINWASEQPWSTGQVGMFGASFQALAQWQVASAQPAALRAIAPSQSPHAGGLYLYQGGAFMLAVALTLVMGSFAPDQLQRRIKDDRARSEDMEMLKQALDDFPARFEQLPLVEQPAMRDVAPYYFDWLAHPDQDDYWRATLSEEEFERVTVPALTIAGWYDLFLRNDLRQYQLMKQRGGSGHARQQQRLIIGPWGHGNFMWGHAERRYDEDGLAVSEQAVNMLTDVQLRWFDRWLKGLDNGVEREKPVRIFVMGIDQWREEDAWPLPDTRYRSYYLHSGGKANSVAGDGVLSATQMAQGEEDVYRYDPHDPVPTRAATNVASKQRGDLGPYDQREIEEREDVLCYTAAPLEHPVEVTGPIELVLYASSSARDTDFTGKLVDVYPDGRAELLADGILRARYRESFARPALMEPGRVYELHIDLGATSNVFRAGHRIRLEVSSSNFPRYDRNSNTGGSIAIEQREDFVPAVNCVYHNELYPSHLILPVIEREG